MKVRKEASGIKESATLAINQSALRLRKNGATIYHYGFGQSPFPVPMSLQRGLAENAWRKNYLPGTGLPELQEAIAEYYRKNFGLDFKKEQILIGPGSKELLFDLLFVLEGTLILPAPSWVSYEPQAILLNKPIYSCPCRYEHAYKLQPEDLAKAAASISGQKLLLLNSPSNPTGQTYSASELEALAKVITHYDITVLSDEIYAELFWGEGMGAKDRAPSIFNFAPDNTVVTSGLSKAYSAGGYRLGFCHLPTRNLLKPMTAFISETFSAVSTPTQYAALAMYTDPELAIYLSQSKKILKEALSLVHDALLASDIRALAATGGFYIYADFSLWREPLERAAGIFSSSELCQRLLDELGIAFLPGVDFGMPDESLGIRIAAVDFDGKKAFSSLERSHASPSAISLLFSPMQEGITILHTWLKAL